MKILCFLGFHKWYLDHPVKVVRHTKTCERCGDRQEYREPIFFPDLTIMNEGYWVDKKGYIQKKNNLPR